MKRKRELRKSPTRYWGDFIFREARLSEAEEIVELEQSVWGESSAANLVKIVSRMKVFPRGNFVAIYQKKIVAYVCIEYVDDLRGTNDNWSSITDYGYIKKSHKNEAEYVYGVNLSVHHLVSGYNIGNKMVLSGFLIAIMDNKKGGFIGSRLPTYASYKKHHPEVSAEDYINVKRNGRRRDYELAMYESEGFEIVNVMPNYFPDPKSLDYGVLIYWKNPFYNWPFKKLIANIVWKKSNFLFKKQKNEST